MKLPALVTLCTASLLIISGCTAKPTPKKEPVVDESLPTVVLTKNGTIADVNSIALEWEPIEDSRVEGIYIYKIQADKSSGSSDDYYETVPNRFSTHYLDKKIEPNTKYNYYFKTYSSKAESKKSPITTIASLAPMESVSWIHGRQNMPRSAKIIWRPHVNEKVKAYVVQRRTLQDSEWRDIATVDGRLTAEYIDKDLKDNFTYKYCVRALTYDGILSKQSQEVTVTTKELPKEVSKIEATTNLPKLIKVTWDGGDAKDFLAYRVYRSTSIDGSYEMLGDTIKTSYVDSVEEDGKEYFYRISVVDKDKLESVNINYSVLGRTLVRPATPSVIDAKFADGRVKLAWLNQDSRVKTFTIQKEYKKGLFETKISDFTNLTSQEFIDSDVIAGGTYYYKIFALDSNGIKSKPTADILIKIEEGAAVKVTPKSSAPTRLESQQPQQRVTVPTEVVDEPKVDIVVPLKDFN